MRRTKKAGGRGMVGRKKRPGEETTENSLRPFGEFPSSLRFLSFVYLKLPSLFSLAVSEMTR